MKHTEENIDAIAQQLVEGMALDDLMNFVKDNLVAAMEKDKEVFDDNVECLQL